MNKGVNGLSLVLVRAIKVANFLNSDSTLSSNFWTRKKGLAFVGFGGSIRAEHLHQRAKLIGLGSLETIPIKEEMRNEKISINPTNVKQILTPLNNLSLFINLWPEV